jgi:glycine dehydrogenase subunit 1
MQYGGGHAGFIATRDEQKYVMQYPSRLFGIVPTEVPGEYGFGDVAYERTSFAHREAGVEFVGTATALWGITAGVYLALMGPSGMQEIGEHLWFKSRYALKQLTRIPGVEARFPGAAPFKEFVLQMQATGLSVPDLNARLQEKGIFGGLDLGDDFPELEGCALFCVTEVHSQEDINRLAGAVEEVCA